MPRFIVERVTAAVKRGISMRPGDTLQAVSSESALLNLPSAVLGTLWPWLAMRVTFGVFVCHIRWNHGLGMEQLPNIGSPSELKDRRSVLRVMSVDCSRMDSRHFSKYLDIVGKSQEIQPMPPVHSPTKATCHRPQSRMVVQEKWVLAANAKMDTKLPFCRRID